KMPGDYDSYVQHQEKHCVDNRKEYRKKYRRAYGRKYQREHQGKCQRAYERRLEYYRKVLKHKPVHMLTADICREGSDKSGMTPERVREEVFLYVWAPVLTEYVEWVLEEAVKAGIKRLYFLARDGYMMYLVARKFVEAREIDLDIRYLKISRFAIRNAEYYFAGRTALDTLCAGGIDISFEKIMKRANLTEEEALHIAGLAGHTKDYKAVLNYRQLCRLKKELSEIDQLFFYIKKHAKDCYETTAAYLRQEGLFEETDYALVDSGWVGTLQLSLQRVLEHEKAENVRQRGYYFGLYARPEGTDAGQYRAFYFGEREIRRKVRFSNCLFETVFSAPEGMTCGYRPSDHKDLRRQTRARIPSCEQGGNKGEGARQDMMPKPVYEALESGSGNPNAKVMERFTELLMQYVSCYMMIKDGRNGESYKADENGGNESGDMSAENDRKASIHEPVEDDRNVLSHEPTENGRNALASVSAENVRNVLESAYISAGSKNSGLGYHVTHKERVRFVESLLSPMMGNPTIWEAEAFGGLMFCDDVLELQLQPVAARWDKEELRKQRFLNKLLIKMNLKNDVLHESAWAEGSIARLGKKAGKSMRQERLYKSFMYLRKAIGK
nr:hypothetical protein [Lachnospiraceae bacterium]